MKHTWRARIGTLAIAACLAFSSMPVFAAGAKQIKVHFEDVTATDATTLSGEAKVKVIVEGADGNVSIAQTALDFDGDLKYKSVNYLQGSDNPGGGDSQITSINGNKITTGIISSKSGMNFGSSEDLFVITFSGEPGKETTLSLSDLENTYFTIDGQEYFPDSAAQITVKTSEKENKGKTATVKLTMDKVTGFSGAAKTGITVKITSEKTDNYSIDTMLDNTLISKGGHRDGTSTIPKFAVKNTVLADDTYTVEVAGIGYITYNKTGVTFDTALEITNAAPIRFVTTQENGKITAEVSNNSITNADPSKKTHGDILLGDGRDGKASTSNVKVVVSGNKSDLTVKNEYPDGTATVSKDVPAGASATILNEVVADTLKLTFKKHTDDERVYDIVLNGAGKNINRLNTAEFDFELSNAAMAYEIKAAHKLTTLQPDAKKYVFYFDGKDAVADSGSEITIGTVTFEGFGTFTFKATAGKATATTTADNLVTEFVTTGEAGKGTLKIGEEENMINAEIKVPTQKLTVYVTFNNSISDQVKGYQKMKAVISGGDLTDDVTVDFGSDTETALNNNVYSFEKELTQNITYTVTVTGEGYRTARYTVTMTGDKTLNFWNNAKDTPAFIEEGKGTAKETNFLAGDIVKDGKINIYDLSAVVSYFGTNNLVSDHPEYAKYDLNRDGKIDSKDVAYVLVSWGK